MLQSFRDNIKGTVATILVVIICIPFVFFGIDSLFSPSSNSEQVAEVDGEPISKLELDRAVEIQRRQFAEQFGDNLPADFFSEENMREPVLKSLIERQAMINAAKSQGMAVSISSIDEIIVQSSEFQVDNKFDAQRYQQLLRGAGFTNQSYKDRIAQDVIVSQFSNGITASNFALPNEVALLAKLGLQTRDFQYLTLNTSNVLDQVSVTEEELQEYYQDNIDLYQNPESVIIEAIKLDGIQLVQNVEITEEEIVDRYQRDKDGFEAKIERRAAHILFDSSTDDYQARLTEVQERLEKGEDFGDLAKEFSDDFGSKDSGGDVGYTTGDSFVEEFEDALTKLQVGEISQPVETEFGVHIIKLLEEEAESYPPLEQKRAEIIEKIKAGFAETLYIEKLADFEDYTYNISDLGPVAEDLGLDLIVTEEFSRNTATGVAAEPQVLQAAFSEELINSGRTSEVLELDNQTAVVIRVVEHSPAEAKPFAEVKNMVEKAVKADKAEELLIAETENAINQLQAGESLQSIAESLSVELKSVEGSKRRQPDVNPELASHVFGMSAPSDSQPAVYDNLSLTTGEVALVALTAVHSGKLEEVSEQELAAIDAQLTNLLGRADMVTVRKRLVDIADIEQ